MKLLRSILLLLSLSVVFNGCKKENTDCSQWYEGDPCARMTSKFVGPWTYSVAPGYCGAFNLSIAENESVVNGLNISVGGEILTAELTGPSTFILPEQIALDSIVFGSGELIGDTLFFQYTTWVGTCTFGGMLPIPSCTDGIQNQGETSVDCGGPCTCVTCPSTVTDIDGNVYGVVKIGNQCWMAENLKTETYSDGTPIFFISESNLWYQSPQVNHGYCYYDFDLANDAIYGKLYRTETQNGGKLCPQGWHVPSKAEYDGLLNALGGYGVAGGSMKSTDPLWVSPNEGATNSSGFSALPGGYVQKSALGGDVNFYKEGESAMFMTTDHDPTFITYPIMLELNAYGTGTSYRSFYSKPGAYSCRCVKDQ